MGRKGKRVLGSGEPYCRRWPKESWCDRDGPGGFMGHTCDQRARVAADARLNVAARRLRAANAELDAAEREHRLASEVAESCAPTVSHQETK